MYPEFNEAIALVSGAASGIGLETALQFIAEGATVIGLDLDEEALGEAGQRLGKRFKPRACDVSAGEQVEAVVQHVLDSFGRLDFLVNNAGVGRLCAVDGMTEEDFRFHYGVNVMGPMLLVTHGVALLRRSSRPSIVNVSSCAARGVFMAHHFLYSSSKAAVLKYTLHLARDLAGIRCNAVLPGWVDTPIYERAGFDREYVEEMYEKCLKTIPSGRIGQPEDIANCVLFLCSDKASYVNGAALDVNGGLLSGGDWGFPF